MQANSFKVGTGLLFVIAAGAMCLVLGCASDGEHPTPVAPKPAPVAQQILSPQQIVQSEIAGVKQNPRFTAAEKAYMIQRIRGGQMGVSVPASSADKPAAKKTGSKRAVNQDAHS